MSKIYLKNQFCGNFIVFSVEEQPLPPVDSPTAESPGYVAESDPEEDPEEYEDDETKDGPVDYPVDGGDDGDDDDGVSSGDDADDKDEDEEDEDEEDEEEEDHLALSDSAVVVPTASISLPPEAEVERLLAMPTPPPSPPISLSPPSAGERLARIALTQALVDAVIAALPSPPLPPLPQFLYIPPPVDRRDDILESERPPRKRSCLFALGFRYEVEESSTARPTIEAVPEIAPITMGEVNTRVTELAELHEHDTQDLYALLEDAQDSRTRISQRVTMDSQRVNLLIEDMIAHQEIVLIVEEEAYASREAWAHAIGLSQAAHYELQTHREHQAEMAELRETGHRHQAQIVETLCVMRDMRREMGNKGVVGLIGWIEKMESVFNINGCAIKNQVKFATCTLLGAALTWWNGQIRTLGPDAYSMTWEVLKKKMTDKYCPQGEIKKLEIELWNLKVKGNDVPTYTERFQELTLICTKFVANETEKVDKYISGLPDNIYGNVKSSRPKTLDETIELANDLMDQKLRTYAERQTDNKRKADDSSRNNHGHQQQPFKRQNVAKVYNMGSGEKKPYGGSLPKCTKCHFHHNGPCTQKCHKCNKVGHFARDCS
ncbi:putative reverse transcriptase domain-containing protein [Tanacetum coccineum]